MEQDVRNQYVYMYVNQKGIWYYAGEIKTIDTKDYEQHTRIKIEKELSKAKTFEELQEDIPKMFTPIRIKHLASYIC